MRESQPPVAFVASTTFFYALGNIGKTGSDLTATIIFFSGASIFFFGFVLAEFNAHHYLEEAISWYKEQEKAGTESSALYSHSADYLSRLFGYVAYSIALLWAGRKHRQQYFVMFVGWFLFIFTPLTGVIGLTFHAFESLLIAFGLVWHMSTPSTEVSTSVIIERLMSRFQKRRSPDVRPSP